MLVTTGEQVSISLLAMTLHEMGYKAISLTGWQAGIETEDVHGKARITRIDSERLMGELEQDQIVIVAGFQGYCTNHEITTLGRGGSDTSAVALAAALHADLCEIYTDVDGVYTTDPRIVDSARKLDEISYDEMLELANLGAAVLHPRSVENAKHYGVKLVVRSSFSAAPGTEIKEEKSMENVQVVTGVAYDMDVTRVQVVDLENKINSLADLFMTLANESINVDMIVTSDYDKNHINVSFSITDQDVHSTLHVLEQKLGRGAKVSHDDHLAKVSIVGAGMISNPGVAAKMFQILSDAGISIHMVTTSEIKVSCLVPKTQAKEAVQVLHDAFELD